MANPHAEDGYVRIANEIIEALAKTRISGTEMQLLWVIIRKTYGWNKKEDSIPLSQFQEMTGIPKPHVVRYLKKLLHKKVITVAQKGNREANTYEFNKDFDQWEPLHKKAITVAQKGNREANTYEFNKDFDQWEPLPKKAITVAQKGNREANTYEFNKDFDQWEPLHKKAITVAQKGNKSLPKKAPSKDTTKDTTKDIYLDFISFTKDEYAKLQKKFGPRLQGMLELFNLKIGQVGLTKFNKKYASHYYTFLNWERMGVFVGANAQNKDHSEFI